MLEAVHGFIVNCSTTGEVIKNNATRFNYFYFVYMITKYTTKATDDVTVQNE